MSNRRKVVRRPAHLVIVPSMSEITTWKSDSHRKTREEHVAIPEYDERTEKEMVFMPFFSLSVFCGIDGQQRSTQAAVGTRRD